MQDLPPAHLVPAAGYASPATCSCTAGREAAGTRDTAFASAKAADGTDQFLKDPLLTTVSKGKKNLRNRQKKNHLYPHVGREKRTPFHPHVISKVMPQELMLIVVPCLPPGVHCVTKTSGRKRAGRRDDRGGHTRRRPVATPKNIRTPLRTAAGRTAAGGVAAFICRQTRPTAPITSNTIMHQPRPTTPSIASSAAGCTNTGGGTVTVRHQPRPTTPSTASSAAGCTNIGGGTTTIRHQPRHTAFTTASSAAGGTSTGGGTTTISHQPRPTTRTTASSAAGCTNTGGGTTTIRHQPHLTTPSTASSAAGCSNTGGGTTTIRHQPRPTPPTIASSAAGCANTGGGSTTMRNETRPTTAICTNPVAGRTAGRTTGSGRGLNSPVPHALGSATDCVSAAAAAGRRLGSGGHLSA